jgi:hypothetical protein
MASITDARRKYFDGMLLRQLRRSGMLMLWFGEQAKPGGLFLVG